MGYRLGVDLGTTYTAAVVQREGAAPEVVPLGTRSAAVPSVLYLSPDLGDILVGEAAERRAVTDPDRVVRQFKRRIGDPTPLLIDAAAGGTRTREYAAHDLAGVLIQWVVARVCEREGAKPSAVAVTHPATWGPHKKDLLRGALAARGLGDVQFVPEPEAAARTYAHSGRLAAGATLAVYDLGGGTFDATVLRPAGDGSFALVGRPHGLSELGGIDFDDAILDHVLTAVGPEAAELDAGDPVVMTALARLRRECVDAKEALSSDTTTEIPVLLPDARTNVRLTRGELEAMIGPRVLATIDTLDATLSSAGLTAADLTNVVLTGGSSRIPVVAQMLSEHLGAPVSLDRDVDPKMAVALGAVLALGSSAQAVVPAPASGVAAAAAAPAEAEPPAADVTPAAAVPAARKAGAGLAPIPARPAREAGMLTTPADEADGSSARSRMRPKRALTLLALTTAIMLGGGIAVSAIGGPGGDAGSTATQVHGEGLDMAKPSKKKAKDDKQTDAASGAVGAGGAATAPASYRQAAPVQSADRAGVVTTASTTGGGSAGVSPASRPATEQASATRNAATRPAAKSGSTEAFTPVTAEEFEAPSVAATEAEPAGASAPDSPADAAQPSAPDSSSDTATTSGWSEPEAPAPAAANSAPDSAPSGFAETAPPEAP